MTVRLVFADYEYEREFKSDTEFARYLKDNSSLITYEITKEN